jgi:polysaccharide chain length determinant protein (PEP-CTERM system associated)
MRFLKDMAQPLLWAVWTHRWLAVGTAWIICVLGWTAVAFLPTQYESSARVYVNTDPVLTPLLKGLAADTDPSRQLDYMKRTLLARPNLEEAVRLAGLDTGSGERRRTFLADMADRVQVLAITPNLLAISYKDGRPTVAKNVVQALLTIFAEKTTGTGRQEMDSAEHFLDTEVDSYQAKLRDLEAKRAALNAKYPDLLPIDKNGSRLDQARNAVTHLGLALSDAIAQRDSLQKELATVPATLSLSQAPQVVVNALGKPNSLAERLEKAKSDLESLRLQYTDQYPDVIAARQKLADLEAEAKKGGGSGSILGAGKSQLPNPVYSQLKLKLVSAETAVAAVQRQLAVARAEEARAEAAAKSSPDVLVKAQDLARDYGVIKAAYDALVQRRQSAQIADAADTKTDRIQFRIVDPPEIPILPSAPNRPLFDSVVLLAGIGIGLAAPVGLLQFDRSVATIGQLRDFGVPVVGSVSRLLSDAARRHTKRQLTAVAASAVVLLIAYGGLIASTLPLFTAGLS